MVEQNDVSVTLNAQSDGRVLILEGSATVPDGARVAYEVKHDSVPGGYGSDVPGFAEGSVEVHGNRFRNELDVENWPRGPVEVWVAFQTVLVEEEQPRSIIDQYGENGERITGNQASGDPIRQVQATARVVLM